MRKTFATRWRNEADDWSADGPTITAVATLRAIRRALERGPIIVEHGHYRDGSAPSRHVLEEWQDFESYLNAEASAGDTIDVWSLAEVCQPENRIAEGKCPAEDGMIPKGGAY